MTKKSISTNPSQASNVLTFEKAQEIDEQVEKELEEERWEQTCAFNTLYADYLVARAKSIRPGKSDDENDKACDEVGAFTWQIINSPAPLSYHVDYKFEIMREIIEQRFVDGRARAMLESIRNDVVEEE